MPRQERGKLSESKDAMSDQFAVFDPRMFISGPFRECPQCGREEYGSLSISNNRHTRRCRECWHTETEDLPRVDKRLIYIDQMVLSHMARELDPEWPGRARGRDPFWADLYDQLERLVKLQVVACPQSPIHEQEASYDDRIEGVLDRLCGHLSAGVRFRFPEEIRALQLWHAQEAYRACEEMNWSAIQLEDVTSGDLDAWADRLTMKVNMGHLDAIDERRARRDRLGDVMARAWKRYQEEQLDFETVYERELRGIADAAVESIRHDLGRHADLLSGKPIDPMALIPNLLSQLLLDAARRFRQKGMRHEEAMEAAIKFMYSDVALNSPQNRLGAMLHAALARRATNGQKRIPNRGTPNDIEMVSSYLPYCEAIFVDNEFAGLLREEPLVSEVEKHGTRVFSTHSREHFFEYLRDIERGLEKGHVERVVDTYGESWLDGFRSILEMEREKEGRHDAQPQQESTPEAEGG